MLSDSGALRPGHSFVITPLKALMADQISGLQRLQIPASFINSDLDREEKQLRFDLLNNNALKLLYVAPERLDPDRINHPDEIKQFLNRPPDFLVIDEAHCVDRWGDDFRPSYGRLAEVRRELGNPPVLAFTATAGVATQQRIVDSLGIPDATVFVHGVDRPNIGLIRHQPSTEQERLDIITNLLTFARSSGGKMLIFVPTIKVGQSIQRLLIARGIELEFFHGTIPVLEKDRLLNQFSGHHQPETDVLLCTNAFGMGLDIPNIRVVVHWVQPESTEDYLQEFGRAGRDGKPAYAVIFKNRGDVGIRKYMARKTAEQAGREGRDASAIYARKVEHIDELERMILDGSCLRAQLLSYFRRAPSGRPSLPLRLIDRCFGERRTIDPALFCCDACQPLQAQKLLFGEPIHGRKTQKREQSTRTQLPSLDVPASKRASRATTRVVFAAALIVILVVAFAFGGHVVNAGKALFASSPVSTVTTSNNADACDPSYPDVCIPPPPPDLDCKDITYRRFRVLPPDPHKLDGPDHDGIGCESN